MDLQRYKVLSSLLGEEATNKKNAKSKSVTLPYSRARNREDKCEKAESRQPQLETHEKLLRKLIPSRLGSTNLISSTQRRNRSEIDERIKLFDKPQTNLAFELLLSDSNNNRSSAIRGSLKHSETMASLSTSTSKKHTIRALYPFEKTDSGKTKPIDLQKTQDILQEITDEYCINYSRNKNVLQKQFSVSRMINSSKLNEQFEDLNIKRHKIYTIMAEHVRKKNAENIANNNNKIWVSPLSTYQNNPPYTKINENQLKSGRNVSTTRERFYSKNHTDDPKTPPTNIILRSSSKESRSGQKRQMYAYDKGTFMKYMLEFMDLSKMVDEIERSKALNQDIENKSLDSIGVEEHIKDVVRLKDVNSPSDVFPDMKHMQKYIKSKYVYLCVLKERYYWIFENRKVIVDRILLALNMDPNKELIPLGWEEYLKFTKILVHYEAPRPDLVKFIINFFKLSDKLLSVSNVKTTFRILCQELQESSSPSPYKRESTVYEAIIENWKLTGIIGEGSAHVNLENMKMVYSSNKLDIYQLLDLITHKSFQ